MKLGAVFLTICWALNWAVAGPTWSFSPCAFQLVVYDSTGLSQSSINVTAILNGIDDYLEGIDTLQAEELDRWSTEVVGATNISSDDTEALTERANRLFREQERAFGTQTVAPDGLHWDDNKIAVGLLLRSAMIFRSVCILRAFEREEAFESEQLPHLLSNWGAFSLLKYLSVDPLKYAALLNAVYGRLRNLGEEKNLADTVAYLALDDLRGEEGTPTEADAAYALRWTLLGEWSLNPHSASHDTAIDVMIVHVARLISLQKRVPEAQARVLIGYLNLPAEVQEKSRVDTIQTLVQRVPTYFSFK